MYRGWMEHEVFGNEPFSPLDGCVWLTLRQSGKNRRVGELLPRGSGGEQPCRCDTTGRCGCYSWA